MKKAKLITHLITALIILFVSNANAQRSMYTRVPNVWSVGIGIEPAIPTVDLYNFSNFSLGGTIDLQYDTRTNLSFTITSGYYNVFAKTHYLGTLSNTPDDAGIVPLKVGLKLFVSPAVYLGIETGAAFETNYADNVKFDNSGGFGFASPKGLDVSFRYETFWGQQDDYGLVALRIAYSFKLKH